jgi:hypothetical protein
MYAVTSKLPSNQLDLPVPSEMVTVKMDNTYRMISKCGKFSVIGFLTHHPTITVTGTTNRAICVQEPMATPRDKSWGRKNETKKS